jgi:hypothetical protein
MLGLRRKEVRWIVQYPRSWENGRGECTGRDWEKRAQEGEGAELGDDGVEEGGVGYWLNDRCPENVSFWLFWEVLGTTELRTSGYPRIEPVVRKGVQVVGRDSSME